MRLIDLRCDWALQYAAESTLYVPGEHPEIPGRVDRLDGYLTGVETAVLVCRPATAEPARHSDPWRALGETITRHEAEFAGRLLIDPDDAARSRAQPADGLCRGVLAVAGLDDLVRAPADLDRLPLLFERGVRVFEPVSGELARPFLERLLALAPDGEGTRPAVDLTDADDATAAAILDWFEAEPTRAARLPLLRSAVGSETSADVVRRLRGLGATLGVSPTPTVEAFRDAIESLAAIPFRGRAGYEGIGVATDYLRIDRAASELSAVARLASWIAANHPARVARALIFENARGFLRSIVG